MEASSYSPIWGLYGQSCNANLALMDTVGTGVRQGGEGGGGSEIVVDMCLL